MINSYPIENYMAKQVEFINSTLAKIQDWQTNDLPIFQDHIFQPIRNNDVILPMDGDDNGLAEITFDCKKLVNDLNSRLEELKYAQSIHHLRVLDLLLEIRYRYYDPVIRDGYAVDDHGYYYNQIFLDDFIKAYDCYKNQEPIDPDDRLPVFRVPRTTEQYEAIIEKIMIKKLCNSEDRDNYDD